MRILRNIFETKAARNESLYTSIVKTGGNSPKYSDVNYKVIAQEGYKRNWIIFRCIQEIMRACISLDWKMMKYNSKGEPEEVPNHPAVQVIEKPNPLYSEAELIKRAIAFYYLGGEAPFHKLISGPGNVKELYVYRPDRVSMALSGDVTKPYTNIKYTCGNVIDIMPEQFMLWKNFNPLDEYDGAGHGMAMAEPILKNGDLLNLFLEWNNSLLNNGGSLSGIIAIEQTLPDKNYNRAKAELKNEHQGAGNVGKFLLLEGGAKYYASGVSPRDMEWKEGKDSTALDIIIGFGLDPLNVGINEQSSYNNKNEAEKGLYTKVAIPLMRELADQLSGFLGLADNEYLDIDSSKIPCLQEDMKELNERLKNTDMTINEKRKARGLDEVEGGDIIAPEGSFAIIEGKVYLPLSLQPVGEETQQQQQNSNNSTQNDNQNQEEDQKSFMY